MLFRLTNVEKGYGGTEILRGLSFQINPGEKVGLVGRNGAGKTTVFRLLTGSENPDEGEVVKANGLKLGLLDQHVNFGSGETVHDAALSAFKQIQDIEAEMRQLENRMETDHSDEVLERYADLQTAFEQADGFTYTARAESILLGLGFSRENWGQDTATLSGGQKNRLGMARLLLSGADVLLLDEPTNHLDVNAVEWLENFLSEYQTAYVVISHDRYFLDRTTGKIIEIDNGKAAIYKGNYSYFQVERELRREQQRREYENQRSHIAKTEEFIRRNLEGQKTKQAKSRRTMLEKMERIDRVIEDRSGGHFGLKKVERAGNNVLTVEELAIGYGNKILATDIGLSLHRSEVLGIIGANGTGKTTFLKTVLGNIPPVKGEVRWGTKTDIGYYAQNLDDLHEGNEIIQELRRVDPLADSGALRSFLARFLFFGEDVFKKVSDLSGGEKGRLALAKLIYSRKNVLILDEPTNHLDIPSREALEDALKEYDGTVITVSHDRFFLDKIATQILAFEPDSVVNVFNGNYTEYHDFKLAQQSVKKESDVRVQDATDESVADVIPGQDISSGSNLSKNQRDRITRRIAEIEKYIADLEAEMARITEEMNRPEVASDVSAFSALNAAFQQKETEVQKLYGEWEQSEAQLSER